jgi:hypothetical protein
MILGKLDIQMQKNEVEPSTQILHIHIHKYAKWIIYLKENARNVNFLWS